jgi:hypothetical protein
MNAKFSGFLVDKKGFGTINTAGQTSSIVTTKTNGEVKDI